MPPNHFETLGLKDNATPSQIKSAFRKLALLHHPDRHVNAPDKERLAEATRFKAVTEAYEVLSDDYKRAAYKATQPGSYGSYGSTSTYGRGSAYGSSSCSTGYSYGYSSSEWSSQTANPYARPRMGFWQAFTKHMGRSGSGARKLELAVFTAVAGIGIASMLSVDKLWEYKNRGKGFDSIGKNNLAEEGSLPVAAGSTQQHASTYAPVGCKPVRRQPYMPPSPLKNPAHLSLAELIELEEIAAKQHQPSS